MAEAEIRGGILTDTVVLGLRLMLGASMIVHGLSKFGNPGFVGWMESFGVSPELAMLIAAGELVPGILLIPGIISRISASVIAVIMLAATVVVHGLESFAGDNGYELSLAMFAIAMFFAIAGPGRLSVAHAVRRLPRFIH